MNVPPESRRVTSRCRGGRPASRTTDSGPRGRTSGPAGRAHSRAVRGAGDGELRPGDHVGGQKGLGRKAPGEAFRTHRPGAAAAAPWRVAVVSEARLVYVQV